MSFSQDLADKAISYALSQGVDYCDARAEKQTRVSVLIENGEIEHAREKSDNGVGLRILKNGAWGFFSITNPESYDKIKEAIEKTIKNTKYYSEKKKIKSKLAPIKINRITKEFAVIVKPDLDSLIRIGLECDKIISESAKIRKSIVSPWFTENSKYFASSEGSEILQNFSDVVVDMVAIAHQS
ncbi:MAG: PmbA/TldA family metallopeptidase, partial [Candidatus Nitrosomaritimum yanchengensis]